ncbi:hypothetical protein PQ455_12705 [Sphingomonas naphthae]|uniref:Uncharacterized protein n=1 Tax=Sphingomonas naphthae TaxID=1813468 RepID=A0ABY7TIE2_9SPHN|nr:hypothetical protein [Sphingomonas naphthae]WCT72492.1 hypothetical protein PQ455_12705 [Sphingomonas naphthae]
MIARGAATAFLALAAASAPYAAALAAASDISDAAVPAPSSDIPESDRTREAVSVAIAACETWLLHPSTWSEGIDRFPARANLAAKGLVAVASVPDAALPPPEARQALHYWRVAAGDGGVFVVTSDKQPICHATGGGSQDFQPAIEAVLASAIFQLDWVGGGEDVAGDMRSGRYNYRVDRIMEMLVSRATTAQARTDRPQLVLTAQYAIGR